MKIIPSSFEILTPIYGNEMLKRIERAGRTCYKSECRITDTSAEKFVASIIKRGHLSVLEHESVSVRIICDRGVSHEVVRHRIGSYSQESTRYCNYGKDNEITVIRPFFWELDTPQYDVWYSAMLSCEDAYLILLANGASPQEARSVLPNSLKTEIVVTYNLREWRHFFTLRCDKAAHPQMRELTLPMCQAFVTKIPVVFDDVFAQFVWGKDSHERVTR